jgi:hypothetical protein
MLCCRLFPVIRGRLSGEGPIGVSGHFFYDYDDFGTVMVTDNLCSFKSEAGLRFWKGAQYEGR